MYPDSVHLKIWFFRTNLSGSRIGCRSRIIGPMTICVRMVKSEIREKIYLYKSILIFIELYFCVFIVILVKLFIHMYALVLWNVWSLQRPKQVNPGRVKNGSNQNTNWQKKDWGFFYWMKILMFKKTSRYFFCNVIGTRGWTTQFFFWEST